ncbi:MAG: ATP-binding protein [Bacteroidota bacterium]
MITRTLNERIKAKIGSGKAIIIVGPRQVGKTTLINHLLKDEDYLFFNGDDPTIRSILDTPNTEEIRRLIGQKKVVFIDEGQRIKNIGLTLKIIVDQFKDVQLWVSGSSSFSLFDELNEPLTGRKWEYDLYPISWEEYENHIGYLEGEQQLENRLLFGFYPDVINNSGQEIEVLQNLVSSYLYRDILAYGGIRKPELLDNLVQALALQVGSEVNYNELSQLLGIDRNTVINYIDILEKGYVLFRLRSYSRNIRNEIKKSRKIYFYDNGIRNTVIGDFKPIKLRTDKGALWENFLIAERVKQNRYKFTLARPYFWRTTQQQEIDYVEEQGQQLHGYEFKWNEKKKGDLPTTFIEKYNAKGSIITKTNFRDFVII